MPLPALAIAGIASAAAALVGSVTNTIVTNNTNKNNADRANRTQKELQEDAQAFDRQMWEDTNAYNDPQAQYERYMAAGINPASMFGAGSSTTASPMTSPMGSAHSASPAQGVDMTSIMSLIPTLLDAQRVGNETKIADAQADNLRAQAGLSKTQDEGLKWDNAHKQEAFDNNQKLINAQIDSYCEQNKKTEVETATLKENLKWLGKLNEKQIESLEAVINKTIADTNLSKAQTSTEYFKQVELAWRADCYSKGIDPDAKGFDKLLNMLLDNPNDLIEVVKRIRDSVTNSDEGNSIIDALKRKTQSMNDLRDRKRVAKMSGTEFKNRVRSGLGGFMDVLNGNIYNQTVW